MTAAVADAVAAVDYDHFVTEPDGSTLPQSSSVASIQQMLEDLDVQPGHRVLEIGTGSGYTTGLLANLAGTDGLVRSVEVFADLVPRAQARLEAAGVTTATVTKGDGYAGDSAGAPYDRVVAWATPHLIPSTWIDQIAQGAVIVAPVKVARLARAHAIVAITVTGGRPTAVSARPGGYIEMQPEPVTVFGLPMRYVDASHVPDDAEPWWLSSPALRELPG
ncbi:protein-L-isoaspartate O-methyltransferase family protein [Promicromonospora soli]